MRQLKISNSITSRAEEAIAKYLSEISRFPLLTQDEEVELAQTVARGGENADKAKEKLVNCNLRFVVSVAKQYQHHGISLIDLINEGNIGLMKAAERYDVTRGFKFISYAVWWIRQSIMQCICENSRMIRLPQNASGMLSKIYRASARFEQEHHRAPTAEEVAELTQIDLRKIEEVMKGDLSSISIDSPIGDDEDGNTLLDMLSSSDETLADRHVDHESLTYDLDVVLAKVLNKREMLILKAFYGIDGPAKGLDEIGTEMALTHERVRQIREKSIAKLRDSEYSHKLVKYLG
jgi:RNA polymerase primary sigma factor